MRFSIVLLVCLCINYLHADSEVLKRIHAHLAIQDGKSACNEAFNALQQFPNDQELSEAYIKALSKTGREKDLISFTGSYLAKYPEKKEQREILETLSWGVIENATSSSAPLIRIYALLAAFYANDAKGVQIIQKSLQDGNSLLRSAAIQLSSELRDSKLQNEILRLMTEEPIFMIRLEAIKAAGLMKNLAAKQALEKIIADDNAELEEKALAIQSLVNLMDVAKREEVQALSKSSRFGFRLLAAQLVLSQELTQDMDLIIPLLKDSRREVRKAALEVLGTLRVSTFQGEPLSEIVSPLLKDIDAKVGVTAAWVLILNDRIAGQMAFQPFLESSDKETRLLAATALAKAGKYGLPFTVQAFHMATDPFVKMNLSFGLIGQSVLVDEACFALYSGLTETKEQLMWVESGVFKYLAPAKISLKELIPTQKEAMNQLARLEILNILSIKNYSKAEDGIRNFLKERSWGISAMASILLLSEGDESSIDLVKNLTKDPDEKIRIQAALILSLWNSGDEAVQILQDSYSNADRELKERILEGIGRIGSLTSIPFLIECLEEPFQSLRVIAASSLLQTLYH